MQKLKKLIASALCVITVICLAGCGQVEDVELDKTRVPLDYIAQYAVTVDNDGDKDDIAYSNTYVIKHDSEKGEINISSKVTEPWESAEGEVGEQIITATARINDGSNGFFGVPIFSEQEFKVTINKAYYTYFSFEHDANLKSGLIKTKKYSANSETGFEEATYSLALREKYYDKDSLPFIIGALPENEGVIYICAGNRDKLQAVKYEFLPTETVLTEAGEFSCKVVRLHPNTVFAYNSACIWFDAQTGTPVKVVQDNSQMVLKNLMSELPSEE